jgi:hypothetical protein
MRPEQIMQLHLDLQQAMNGEQPVDDRGLVA